MHVSKLQDKKILILGLGEEGIDSLRFFKNNIRYKKLGVADSLPFDDIPDEKRRYLTKEVDLHFGEKYLLAVKDYEIIVKSPGIPLHCLKKDKWQIITSQSDIFLSNCKKNVIGVTGTKGKSTTCTILYETLNLAGIKVALVGNIGRPALSYLLQERKYDYFIYELSSFQLQTIRKSPHIAVLLNIFKDHLDKHSNFDEYIASKEKITAFQEKEDYFVYNKDDGFVKKISEKTKAKKVPFDYTDPLNPILSVMNILKIEKDYLIKALRDFKGLPHRLEYIGEFKGILFYNDSASTIPEATVKALKEIKKIQTLILGGSDKGGNIEKLIDAIKESKVENIVILKGTEERVGKELKKHGKKVFPAADMKSAVDFAFENTNRGNACVLSPGFTSFNMFNNYKERGVIFTNLVQNKK